MLQEMSKNTRIKRKVLPKIVNKEVETFEKSEANLLRSVSIYYSGGVMGKKKYCAVYRDSCYRKVGGKRSKRIALNNCRIPKLVPYNKLMPFIKDINIGKLYSVRETLCDGLEEHNKVSGIYRDLSDLITDLAKFYLSEKCYDLVWFGGQTNTFHVSIGGDGAPFGKDDTACAWLVSFLNTGRAVLSSNENYLLFGSNCSENCIPVCRFLKMLHQDIQDIESKTFSVTLNNNTVVDVKFVFSELPNDMKMLAFIAGELTNSAQYFSTFANVQKQDINNADGTFALDGQNSTWKPWEFDHRVKVVKEVEILKKSLAKKKVTEATKRNNITKYIAACKSRQEFMPLLGHVIDRAHVDPLHVKNNACALAHKFILNQVLSLANLSNNVCFANVPPTSCFYRYIDVMRNRCNLSRLAKRIIRWFDESRSSGKVFDYRFTGKDSRLFLHNFMLLISSVDRHGKTSSNDLHIISYVCLCLRDAVSLFSRVDISDSQVSELKSLCIDYFRTYALFLSANPTVWTIGHLVPAHTEHMKQLYDMGLGLNSMEGREAKHVFIGKYSVNTLQNQRWEQIFRHEYVSLIWLRERGYNTTPTSSNIMQSYIPQRVKTPEFCNCGMTKDAQDENCWYCSHPLRERLKVCIKQGKKSLV